MTDRVDPSKASGSNVSIAAPVPTTGVPLWRQLNAVARVLLAVRAGQSWTTAQLDIEAVLRPGVQALAFAVLRQYGTAQALRSLLVQRAPGAAADALLCSVLALAIVTDAAGAAYEPHTLVNQAVEAAKRNPATRPQANFINACLRRFLRERDALLATALQQDLAQWNHPVWWLQRLRRDYAEQWQAIAQANALPAPLTLRVNTSAISVPAYQEALIAKQQGAHRVALAGLELEHSAFVPGLPGYAQGWFSVQDAAAQLAAPLLLDAVLAPPGQPLRVLDACAAPGGKTAHLLEYAAALGMAVEVTALDVDAARCQRIHENLDRLQLKARVLVADAAKPGAWWDGMHFDAILLDAPCSASGIVRRHPDIRWLRRDTDIAQLVGLQQSLLQALWPLLKHAAPLLYCTCSVFKSEGQDQIQTFVAHHSDAALLPSPGHLLPQSPLQPGGLRDNHLGGHDGFFYALLQKTAALV